MTRANGVIDSAAGLLPFGHLGWGFRSRAEFLVGAAEYIVDGLTHDQRVVYVGEGTRAELTAELAGLAQLAHHDVAERVDVRSASDHYTFLPGTDVLDPDASLQMYLAAVQDAVAAGYSGFRAVVDATCVARSPQQRATLADLEVRVDREMAVRPFSALCAYDISALGAGAAELVCLHPYISREPVTFQLFAEPDDQIDFVLCGELDVASDDVFTTTLQRLWPTLPRATARIDARSLRFVSHRQLITLDRHARDHDREVVLQTSRRLPGRLVDLLDLTNVRVEQPPVRPPDDGPLGHAKHRLNRSDCRLRGEPVVAQVKSMLSQGLGIDEQQAFAVLVDYAQQTDTALPDVARRVRDELSHAAPCGVRDAALRTLQSIRNRLPS